MRLLFEALVILGRGERLRVKGEGMPSADYSQGTVSFEL